VPAGEAKNLLPRYPELCWAMLKTVGARLAQVEGRMEEVAYKPLSERLARLLLELSGGKSAIRGTSHQTLASMLGTYRETVSALLGSFKQGGLVEIGYREIRVRDPGRLRAAAGTTE
jgi:CRP/FNR family transcriptional regulator, cyclic AMP receptor protein